MLVEVLTNVAGANASDQSFICTQSFTAIEYLIFKQVVRNRFVKYINIKIVFFSFFICGLSCSSQKLISKDFPNNPISYTFKMKIENPGFFLEKYVRRFNTLKFFIHDIFYNGSSRKVNEWPDAVKNSLSGEANKNDIWMQLTVDSSDIYFNKKGKPFEYLMECVAHFTAIDSNTTRIEIIVLNAKIHLRNRLLPSPPHFVKNPVYKKVKPTTIEEYKILQSIGKWLEVIDLMPKLKLSP
jgi:hypothetical protein